MRTTTKRDWPQIALNVMMAAGLIFLAYKAVSYPRPALMVLFAIAKWCAFVGAVSFAFWLVDMLVGRPIAKAWRSERADRVRLRLLHNDWIWERCPRLWAWLREDVRRYMWRNGCCEMSDCWNEPTCTWEHHKVCSEHYAEIAEIAAARQARL